MALRALDNKEHSRLLQKISDLSFEESQGAKFEKQLNKLFEEYNTMLVALAAVIADYREVTAQINARQPLVKRKEPQETGLRSKSA